MIIAEGFKPRRQGLCPPSQPPAAVLSSSPPVAVKKSASQSLSALSGANKMIMVSNNRHHNRQHCQVDQSVDLQLPLPLQPLHQLPAPPLLLLHPLLPPHLNKVMRIGRWSIFSSKPVREKSGNAKIHKKAPPAP